MNFDHDLLRFDSDVVDDVIVRELLHFFVPNQGKLWKSLMQRISEDSKRLRKNLDSRRDKAGAENCTSASAQ